MKNTKIELDDENEVKNSFVIDKIPNMGDYNNQNIEYININNNFNESMLNKI